MADNDKPKFDIPWGTLLPLIAVLAGVIAQYKPLVSKRPTVPSEKTIPVIAAQDVDARLWQDPFSVAEKQKSLLDAQIEVGVAKKGTTESHDVCADRKSTRLNSSHSQISYAVFCLEKINASLPPLRERVCRTVKPVLHRPHTPASADPRRLRPFQGPLRGLHVYVHAPYAEPPQPPR